MKLEAFAPDGRFSGQRQRMTFSRRFHGAFTGTTAKDRFDSSISDAGVSKLIIREQGAREQGDRLRIAIAPMTFAFSEPSSFRLPRIAICSICRLRGCLAGCFSGKSAATEATPCKTNDSQQLGEMNHPKAIRARPGLHRADFSGNCVSKVLLSEEGKRRQATEQQRCQA